MLISRHLMKFSLSICILLFCMCITHIGFSCTRILKADKQPAVLVGRTMDWSDDMNTHLIVYPQGIERDGYASHYAMKWTSKYGSLVATAYEDYTTDGINERGLAAHILWLDETDYGKRDDKMPGLSVMQWTQFYLDNFKTVDEAVRFTEATSFQVLPFYHQGIKKWINLHLALEDANGDSAIIEYIEGRAHIYHDRSYTVLTNSPTYDKQLKNLYQFESDQTINKSDKPLPGTTNSEERFIRAAFYAKRLPAANSVRSEITHLFSVINNIAQPYGVSTPERRGVSPTLWLTVSDLTHRVYYFHSSSSFNVIWAQLDKFNLQPGSPIMKLDRVADRNLMGDVTNEFKPV